MNQGGNVDLRTALVQEPREKSGSRSANRFSFQHSWALCHLLVLHAKPEDYVLLLDHHEDVVVLDSAIDPTRVRAFQVKTKDKGNWTIGALLKRKTSKKKASIGLPSILGKLYDAYQRFQSVDGLHFVSNASLGAAVRVRRRSAGPAGGVRHSRARRLHAGRRTPPRRARFGREAFPRRAAQAGLRCLAGRSSRGRVRWAARRG